MMRLYKTVISILFGMIGFAVNFYPIRFEFPPFTATFVIGLIFPMLIAQAWGWRYGLLSALCGGCQTMWWLWGSVNGYATLAVVPPYTLWILFHGWLSQKRRGQDSFVWWSNVYIAEIAFRILPTINLYTLARWLITLNPPGSWATNSATEISMRFTHFVVIKQFVSGYFILLLADILLNYGLVRKVLRLPRQNHRSTTLIISASILAGLVLWLVQGVIIQIFDPGLKGAPFLANMIYMSPPALAMRLFLLAVCLVGGLSISKAMQRRLQAERDLQESEERFRSLVETTSDFIWEVDPNGVYTYVSPAIIEILGRGPEEVVNKPVFDLMPPDEAERVGAIFRETAEARQPFERLENVNLHKDGQLVVLETNGAPIFDKQGNLLGYRGTDRDITERKQTDENMLKLQAQLQQSQKLEAIGTLAGGIAHDFNNILAIILGYTQLAMNRTRDDDLKDDLGQVMTASLRAMDLTKHILTFSRRSDNERRPMDLRLIIKEALKLLRASIPSTTEIETDFPPELPNALVDPTQVHQIVMNLCLNASQSMGDKPGLLSIGLETVEFCLEDTQLALNLKPGNYICLTVSDTGPGIDADNLDRIFEPYFTTKAVGEGTGLGLATVHGIVTSYGGMVRVYSEPGQGASFKVYLPALEDEAKPAADTDTTVEGGSERILLVDDEEALARMEMEILTGLGYQVDTMNDSQEALDIFRAQPQKYDLVITDYTMPGMNGLDMAEAMINIRPNIPIILCTGFSARINRENPTFASVKALVKKPFLLGQISRTVRQVLDQEPNNPPGQ